MADIGTLYPEDHIFGDVGGVVGNAFQVAGDQQGVQCLPDDLGPLVHGLHQLDEGVVAHAVNDAIHFENCLGKFDLALDKRFQRAPHHGTHRCAHASDVHGKVGGGKPNNIHEGLGNVPCLASATFCVEIDLGDCNKEPQAHLLSQLHT